MKNNVSLIGFYGGDKTHALSAWQSTNVELDIELSPDVQKRINQLYEATVVQKSKEPSELLKMLAQHGHHTPFEKSALHFQITADIATHIHCLKHRAGVGLNSESARYKKLKDKHYIPKDFYDCLITNGVSKEVALVIGEDLVEPPSWGDVLESFTQLSETLYSQAAEALTKTLGRKRAKESSRFFLTYNKQVDYDMMFNFRSFQHFQNLRNSEHAQVEVREVAQQMLDLVKGLPEFEHTLKAFNL